MANVLDLRRRIRSVKNTRQITKAMKMVSAAKLRRAQERALHARPYARMLVNVLESLVRRTDLYNEASGEIMHPLLVEREEKNVLVLVIAGDKGFAGGFNSNIGKAAQRFIDERREQGQNLDLEPIGKKAIALYKRYLNIGRPYDAVIMDLTVVGGMGGEETFRALHELDPDVRAIVSSGYDNEDMARQYLEMGFCGYLTKPYRVTDLGKVIKAVLG